MCSRLKGINFEVEDQQESKSQYHGDPKKRKVLLLFHEPLSTRVFFECGIVEKLLNELGDRLVMLATFDIRNFPSWQSTWESGRLILLDEWLRDFRLSLPGRLYALIDRYLDRYIGFFPLAIRLNFRHGFHTERMSPGHSNTYLDLSRKGPLPSGDLTYRFMFWWLYSRCRFLEPEIRRYLKDEVSIVVTSHLQHPGMMPFMLGAKRLKIPIVGYIASWDHLVGKGVVFPSCRHYIVQNEIMNRDLRQYHAIKPERITTTGWPQTDLFAVCRPKVEFDRLIGSFGLDPKLPTVLVVGNSVTNAPYEPAFFKRLLAWWVAEEGHKRFNLLFRPHPKDIHWRERFDVQALMNRPGVHVQTPTFTDMEVLVLLLQHAACVLTNAGTILLDSLINNRPVVSVLYDEGESTGSSFAYKNVIGEHYKELMASSAFYRAYNFDEVVAGIMAGLSRPGELHEQCRAVAAQIVGKVDGRAAERVVKAIMDNISD